MSVQGDQMGSMWDIFAEEREERRREAGPYLFVIGQVVQMKGGGPTMVVVEHLKVPHTRMAYRTAIACRWFTTDGLLQENDFDVATLREAIA